MIYLSIFIYFFLPFGLLLFDEKFANELHNISVSRWIYMCKWFERWKFQRLISQRVKAIDILLVFDIPLLIVSVQRKIQSIILYKIFTLLRKEEHILSYLVLYNNLLARFWVQKIKNCTQFYEISGKFSVLFCKLKLIRLTKKMWKSNMLSKGNTS